MHNHPFAKQRFEQAHENLFKLKSILESGDLNGFIALIESEALTLHAMMMTSNPYFILMKPNTLKIINKIWDFRNRYKFTYKFYFRCWCQCPYSISKTGCQSYFGIY